MNSSFSEVKEKYDSRRKEPLYLPGLIAPCDLCECGTGTKILFMKAGLGNSCERCGRFRRGKRFISKSEFVELTNPVRESAEVGHVEETRL